MLPTPSVPRLNPKIHDYLSSFGLFAIAHYRNGRYAAVPDPVGAATAHWCKAEAARALVRVLRRDGGDVADAARKHDIAVTEHSVAVARATVAVARIEAGLDQARRSGVLAKINSEYKRRRTEAAAEGEPFPSYTSVLQQLRQTFANVAAGQPMPSDLVTAVFASKEGSLKDEDLPETSSHRLGHRRLCAGTPVRRSPGSRTRSGAGRPFHPSRR